MTKPFILGEPSVYKREWINKSGKLKSSYVVRWRVGIRDNRGRSVTREKRGFRTKEAARKYFYDHVLPAVDEGHASPNEQNEIERQEEEEKKASRKYLGDFFEPLIIQKPVHIDPKSFQNNQAAYRLIIKVLGKSKPLETISFEDIEKVLAYPTVQKKQPSGPTVRKRFFSLRSAFERAKKLEYIIANPCDGIKVPKQGKGRLRYLVADECCSLLSACKEYIPRRCDEPDGDWLHAFVLTAIYTGARLDELNHLEWSDISWNTNQIYVQNKPAFNWSTKNKKSRPLGVNKLLFDTLKDFHSKREDINQQSVCELEELEIWANASSNDRDKLTKPPVYRRYDKAPGITKLLQNARGVVKSLELQKQSTLVFPNPWGKPRTEVPEAYWSIIEKLGLKNTGVVFHTLRHTYASHLAMTGVDMPTLKELMGHQSIVTTMQYAHLAPDHASMKGALMPEFNS